MAVRRLPDACPPGPSPSPVASSVVLDLLTALPTTSPVRLARAAAFGAVATGLADLAHRMAGHEASIAVTGVGCVTAAWLVWPSTERSLSALRLLVTTVTLQWVLHAAFVLAEPTGHTHAEAGGAGPTGGGSTVVVSLAELIPGGRDVRMFATHMGAAGALALWLALGERLVFQVADLGVGGIANAAASVAERMRRAVALLAASTRRRHSGHGAGRLQGPRWPSRRRHRDRLFEHALARRGPPRQAAVSA